MSTEINTFSNLSDFVNNIRESNKKTTLMFAYNGTGKTRLSMSFKEEGKDDAGLPDTLYFNAFTEDLFWWNNDLENDTTRFLNMNTTSRFFEGLESLEMDNRVRPFLREYYDFDFIIKHEEGKIYFRKEITNAEGAIEVIENIKISRGEERIFIWCFFLAIAQLAIDNQAPYDWVKYLYIDDPISSLDDNNSIAVAHHLARLLKTDGSDVKTIVSTHHSLFFNVLCNEFGGSRKLLLRKSNGQYDFKWTNDTPFFYHISIIQELQKAIDNDNLFTYHFNILRNILEKAANFHGFKSWRDCLVINDDDEEGTLYARMINILNHGGYSLFEPIEMGAENKGYFAQIFENFKSNYKFNEELFNEPQPTAI